MNLPIEVQSWIYEHRTTVSAAGASAVATVLGFPLDSSACDLLDIERKLRNDFYDIAESNRGYRCRKIVESLIV